MEFLFFLGKQILLVPLWALMHSPFLRWSVKLNKVPSVSLQAAFTLGLVTAAASLIVSLLLYPLYVLIETPLADGISWVVVVSATIWLYGYFLRGEAGSSIGLWRGGKVFAVELVLFLAFLFSFAYVVVLAVSALT